MVEHTTSRRRFLGTAAGATGVALGAAVWGANQAAAAAVSSAPAQRLMADKRGFIAGRFAIDIGTQSAGWVQDADGGQAFSDVVVEKLGADNIAHKHIAGVKYEDIAVTAGFGLEKTFYDWIAASWNNQLARKDGAIVAADFNMVERTRRNFYNALITETTIPACDASLKQASYLTVKWAPAYTQTRKGDGSKVSAPIAVQQKTWLPSNFKLAIDGLDCSKVNKIDSFTVKQSIVQFPTGEVRDGQESSAAEFPNLAITFPVTSSATWEQWFDDFLIKGNNGQGSEKSGTLTFLSPNLQSELGTVKFFNMGIFKLDDDASEDASGNPIQRFKAELYVERMEISIVGGAGKPGPTPTPPPNGP